MTRIKYGEKFVTLVLCDMIDVINREGRWSFCTLSKCPVKNLSARICISTSEEDLFKRLVLDLTCERRLEDMDYLTDGLKGMLRMLLREK